MMREAFVMSVSFVYDTDDPQPVVVTLHVPALGPGSEIAVPVSREDGEWLSRFMRAREPVGLLGRSLAALAVVYGETYKMLSRLPDDVRDSPLLIEVFNEIVGLPITETMTAHIVGMVRYREREQILAGNPPGDS